MTAIPYASIQGGLGWEKVGFYGGYAYLTGGYTNEEYAKTVVSKLEYAVNGILESTEADTPSYQHTRHGLIQHLGRSVVGVLGRKTAKACQETVGICIVTKEVIHLCLCKAFVFIISVNLPVWRHP